MYISNSIDLIYCDFFQPCITEPARVVSKKKLSLTDHIFINTCTKQLNVSNLVDKISDHLPNFLIISQKEKLKTQIRDMKNFD